MAADNGCFAPQGRIWFAVPGAKHYQNRYYTNHPRSFVNISITGQACSCRCAHCGGRLLETMTAATTPKDLRQLIDHLSGQGCQGILISGGSDPGGEVPLLPFIGAISHAKEQGLKVVVHSGLLRRETARALAGAGVDQVMLDVIGDLETIQLVYHLERRPEDYLEALRVCQEAGVPVAPHVVVGLHFGKIRGEINALSMIGQVTSRVVVLVIITPMKGTAMEGVIPPSPHQVAEVMAAARELNPGVPLALGCARPPGSYKRRVEHLAVDFGFSGIAFPDESTVAYALDRGYQPVFTENCCSLLGVSTAADSQGQG